jgi:NAD(P)-dependent dehydrogenase (short-subunit alcohol dehydrogenase family)
MQDLVGKVAFVTGAASGIGFAMAHAFLRADMKVMLADIEASALDSALAQLKDFGQSARGVGLDVTDRGQMKRAAEEAIKAFGRVNVVCNNAGVGGGQGALQGQIPAADWDWTIDVNLNGVFNGIAEFLPRLRAQGEGGHIVNTASMGGIVSLPGMAAYCASKFAVVALSEGLAAEFAGSNIGVSVLCPGWVKTRILESERNRQARYGPNRPPDKADLARASMVASAVQMGMDPVRIAERVVTAIRANELYIFTNKGRLGQVEERFRRILAALERAEQ